MALNAPIQGSAADIIKVAMLNVDRALREQALASRMLLQVHDELVFEVADGEHEALEALVREQMASAAELTVPLDVSVGTGQQLARRRPLSRSRRPASASTSAPGCSRARCAARLIGQQHDEQRPCRRASTTVSSSSKVSASEPQR